jgi:hypothetical protein
VAACVSTTDGSKRPAASTTETANKRRVRYGAMMSALTRRAKN